MGERINLSKDVELDPIDFEPALSRLENTLGLARPRLDGTTRLFRYASAIEKAALPRIAGSLATDRLATAAFLLRRREEALLAGWDGLAEATPAVRELAVIEGEMRAMSGSDLDTAADRLRRILEGLHRGLSLPPNILIAGNREHLPPLWTHLLDCAGGAVAEGDDAHPASGDGALADFQESLGCRPDAVETDESLALAQASSRQGAAQAIAALLAMASAERRASTVVVCDEADLLTAIDDRLARSGLPRLGAPPIGERTALDGLLPLALALCWEPVDPDLLLEFCVLPGGPLGRRTGNLLGIALSEFPGLGSRSWKAAVAKLTATDADPDGKLAAKLARWFDHQRVPKGKPAPASLLAVRCRTVAAWSGARAATAEGDQAERYGSAAGVTSRLAELIETAGHELSFSSTTRLLEDALPGCARSRHPAEASGPLLVKAPCGIPPGTPHVIWIAPCAPENAASPWTALELRELRAAKLPVSNGTRRAAARRSADRQGLLNISESLLFIELPAKDQRRRHPALISLRNSMQNAEEDPDRVPVLDNPRVFPEVRLAGWLRGASTTPCIAPQPERPVWDPPQQGLSDREIHSYSELERRLACPLSWVLTYAAKLRHGTSASLPEDHTLQGTFAHAVLEGVLAGPVADLLDAEDRAGKIFDQRVETDATPLMAPGRGTARLRLKNRIQVAARTIADVLTRSGCEEVVMEAPIDGEVDGWRLGGRIDCLATSEQLAVIIDIKLGSLPKRRELLAEGRAVQLAVYAATHQKDTVAAGYYIINGRRLLVPEASPVPGTNLTDPNCEVVPGAPDWRATWRRFSAAIGADRGWLNGEAIPARPIGESNSWPDGANLVLGGDEPECCKWCDFGILCGRARRA